MPQHETHGSDEPLMSHGTINPQTKRRIGLIALAVMVVTLIAAEPCSAQGYWGGWGGGRNYGGNRSYSPQRDFFFPFSGVNRPPPVADSTKAPASRKLETPPANTVMVVGDSMADWLAYGLDELYTDEPSVGFERKIRASSGLIRYDAKNEALDWSQATKDALANARPNAIIVMLGLNDRIPLRDKASPQPAGNAPASRPKAAKGPKAARRPKPAKPRKQVSQLRRRKARAPLRRRTSRRDKHRKIKPRLRSTLRHRHNLPKTKRSVRPPAAPTISIPSNGRRSMPSGSIK